MSEKPIRSYREASRYSGVPITSLRDAIARGEVPQPTTDADGKTVWDVEALDALRAARGSGTRVRAEEAAGESVGDSAPAAASNAVTASWLLAATARCEPVRDDGNFEDDAVVEDEEEQSPQPANVNATPLGARPLADWLSGASTSAVAQARIAELKQQLATAQAALSAQVESTTSWRALFRSARIKSIADTIAFEAIAAGALPIAAQAAARAAADAVGALPDEQLVLDVAFGIGRQYGHSVGAQAAAWAQAMDAQRRDDHLGSDIDRARDRRTMRRGRARDRW